MDEINLEFVRKIILNIKSRVFELRTQERVHSDKYEYIKNIEKDLAEVNSTIKMIELDQ